MTAKRQPDAKAGSRASEQTKSAARRRALRKALSGRRASRTHQCEARRAPRSPGNRTTGRRTGPPKEAGACAVEDRRRSSAHSGEGAWHRALNPRVYELRDDDEALRRTHRGGVGKCSRPACGCLRVATGQIPDKGLNGSREVRRNSLAPRALRPNSVISRWS